MKIYIAGKITGDSLYRAKFAVAERRLIARGHIPMTPTMLPQGMTKADYMRVCFAMIDVADAVYFLTDYEASPGAMLEWGYCRYIGKRTIEEEA